MLSRCYSWNDRRVQLNVVPLGTFWMSHTGHFQDWATLNMHDPVLVEFLLVPEQSLPRSGGRSAALQLVPVVLALAALVWLRSC